MKKKEQQHGVILITVTIILVLMAIFLPTLYFLVANEGLWSTKYKKTNIAFQMAEQAIDRGLWKLKESSAYGTVLSTGGIIPGYNFDTVYQSVGTDSVVGEYKIKLSSYSGQSGYVVVQTRGRDLSAQEVRSIQAVYALGQTSSLSNTAIYARTQADLGSNLEVHWGPIINLQNITKTPNYDYPRKISKGSI